MRRKVGGLAVFLNRRWWNMGHITIWEQLRSKDDELVAISTRPYHLPGAFFHITVVTVYCTSQPAANGGRGLWSPAYSCEQAANTVPQWPHGSLETSETGRNYVGRIWLQHKGLVLIHPQSPEFKFLWDFSSTFNSIQPILLLGKME